MQDVSGVYGMLTLPNASLRHAAAGLVVQLLPDQGKEAVEEAQEQLQVGHGAVTCAAAAALLWLICSTVGMSVAWFGSSSSTSSAMIRKDSAGLPDPPAVDHVG